MRRLLAVACLAWGAAFGANVVECQCDPAHPETLAARSCALCREAEKQPRDQTVFLLKDSNPSKPNRWLVLPRTHAHSLAALTPEERTALWTAAIANAKRLFGDDWGVAVNGRKVVTQCHTHVHIGRLLPGVEWDNFVIVAGPADIPVPVDGGLWIHPAAGKLHVHTGEQITETVLLR